MNLFWLRAALLADPHVVKMPLEYAQLLSNAYYTYGQQSPCGYRETHARHPCSIWVAQSRQHWDAVVQLAFGVLREYTRRFSRVHACWYKIAHMVRSPPRFDKAPPTFKSGTARGQLDSFNDVPLCMPEEFMHESAAVAYHRYYLFKLRTVPRCSRWNRDADNHRRAMHAIAVLGMLCHHLNWKQKKKIKKRKRE